MKRGIILAAALACLNVGAYQIDFTQGFTGDGVNLVDIGGWTLEQGGMTAESGAEITFLEPAVNVLGTIELFSPSGDEFVAFGWRVYDWSGNLMEGGGGGGLVNDFYSQAVAVSKIVILGHGDAVFKVTGLQFDTLPTDHPLVTTPDGGATFVLLGIALAGLVAGRRHLKAI